MSADVLRKAAALIRERATSATSGPWEFRPRRGFQSMGHDPATIGFLDEAGYFAMLREGTWAAEGDMAYIASWHPAVALAVADQLDAMANVVDEAEGTPLAIVAAGLSEASVAVACAYLGSNA